MSCRTRDARPSSALSSRSTLLRRTPLSSGSLRVRPPGEAEAAREHLRGVVDVGGQVVEELAIGVHYGLDGGLEQLRLGLEVVVEGARPDVSGLGDCRIGAFVLPSAMSVCAARMSAARVRALRRSSRLPCCVGVLLIPLPLRRLRSLCVDSGGLYRI